MVGRDGFGKDCMRSCGAGMAKSHGSMPCREDGRMEPSLGQKHFVIWVKESELMECFVLGAQKMIRVAEL